MTLPSHMRMKSASGNILVPSVGFGTWAAGDTSWCYTAILEALKAGYRHIDCAWNYGVDEAVRRAIRDSKIPREEIFITSKFWPQFGAPDNVGLCLDLCLKGMGLDYVDLFLAHWPVALKATPDLATAKASPNATSAVRRIATNADGKTLIDWTHTCESLAAANGYKGSFKPTWQAMQNLVHAGKARAVGVSNFNVDQLHEVMSTDGKIPVSCNQIEAHPWFPNTELIDFMAKHDILATVYCPLGGTKSATFHQDSRVQELASKNQMGVGQLLQSWAVQRGTIPLGKSQNAERLCANLDVRSLPKEDFETLNNMSMGESGRTCDIGPPVWGIKIF